MLLFWSLRGPAADVAVERGEWLALVLFVCHVPSPALHPLSVDAVSEEVEWYRADRNG